MEGRNVAKAHDCGGVFERLPYLIELAHKILER